MRSDKERVTGKGAPSFWSQRIHKQGSHFLPGQEREEPEEKLVGKRSEERKEKEAARKGKRDAAPRNVQQKKNEKA